MSRRICNLEQLKAEQQRIELLICEKEELIANNVKEVGRQLEPYWQVLNKLEIGFKLIKSGLAIIPLITGKKKKETPASRWKAIAATTISTMAETGILQNLLAKAMGMFASKKPENDAYYED